MEQMNKIKLLQFKGTISVDPGWNTGLAYWVGDNEPLTHLIKEPPKLKKNRIEVDRMQFMFERFRAYLKVRFVKRVLIEGVEMWQGSTKSMTAAARGDLFALSYLVGGYSAIAMRMGFEVSLVYARGGKGHETWKGQLTPEALALRIDRLNGQTYPEHIREAVGIGFHKLGVL